MNASRAEELGQLLFIGLEEDCWSSALEKRLRTIRPAGIILNQANLTSPDSAAALTAKIAHTLDTPPFLALVGEVGTVNPLPSFFPPLPSPLAVAAMGPRAARELGKLSGAGLKLMGFNMTFAPSLDISSNPANATVRQVSFGVDGEKVAALGEAFVQGLQSSDVLACPKSFPGFGDARPDADSGLLTSAKPMARMWREDLVPYRNILPRVQLVMVSYLAYKAYDLNSAIPASISSNVLEGLLRVKLGYRGICLADYYSAATEMLSFLNPSTPGSISMDFETLPKSIAAGVDILVVMGGARFSELVGETLKKSQKAGTLTTQRISEAIKRIARAKKGLRRPTGKFSKKTFDRICREFEDFSQGCRSAERGID
ncbi:MAG TPA: glycoside hydrolase family 3 N-terminal domain-containing protein [Terriglobia bacterium]|nr:glycoside hydrolase family 3 N-terminal domain-containing protein [Terriglobia bacterium]